MAGTNNTSQWEAPIFSFSTANQAEEWKTFYVRVLNYLETLDIDIEAPDQKRDESFPKLSKANIFLKLDKKWLSEHLSG